MPEALVYQALGAIFISNWGQIPIKSWLVVCLLLAGARPGQPYQKEELSAPYQQALDAKINWSLTPIRLTPIRFPNRCKRVVNWNLTPIKGAGGVA